MLKEKVAEQLYAEGKGADQLHDEGHYMFYWWINKEVVSHYVYGLYIYYGIWHFGELNKLRAYRVDYKYFSSTSLV